MLEGVVSMVTKNDEHYTFHPLDVAEHFAQKKQWECFRVTQEELALAVEGRSGLHAIKLLWFAKAETLILQCTMNMEPLLRTMNEFYNLVNQCNRILFRGKFFFAEEEFCLTYETHLLLVGEKLPTLQQLTVMVSGTVTVVDNFLPAFTALANSQATAMEIIENYKLRRLQNKI